VLLAAIALVANGVLLALVAHVIQGACPRSGGFCRLTVERGARSV
jgi:hypothetical protein